MCLMYLYLMYIYDIQIIIIYNGILIGRSPLYINCVSCGFETAALVYVYMRGI